MAIFISEPAFPPTPVYTENGIEYKQCAPSNSPVKILSRTFAQDDSLVTTTSTPYFLNSPNSFAITIGEQSVSGINPNRTGSFCAVIVVKAELNTTNKTNTDDVKRFAICFFIVFILNRFKI